MSNVERKSLDGYLNFNYIINISNSSLEKERDKNLVLCFSTTYILNLSLASYFCSVLIFTKYTIKLDLSRFGVQV